MAVCLSSSVPTSRPCCLVWDRRGEAPFWDQVRPRATNTGEAQANHWHTLEAMYCLFKELLLLLKDKSKVFFLWSL